MKNTYNPFLNMDNVESLTQRLLDLIPKGPTMSPEERAAFDKKNAENRARYDEARNGALPAGVYRILEQGGFVGWHLGLEIDGEEVVLKEPDQPFTSAYAVYHNKARAEQIARLEIALRHGQAAAETAQFRYIWGGCL